MHLQTLKVVNFKNYKEAEFEFSPKINVLVGKNGSGKTNLLDAIHYLSFTKSAFFSDQYSVRHGEDFFVIHGTFVKHDRRHVITCAVQAGKKTVREDEHEYEKLSEHIGKYSTVLVVPDDTDVVREGSEHRRRFFDTILSQFDSRYLQDLITYNYALRQRNSLLKMFAQKNSIDEIALESYDRTLIDTGKRLHEKRDVFTREFMTVFQHFYKHIAEAESAGISYVSQLADQSFDDGLMTTRSRDVVTQRTNFGVHRDEFRFTLGNGDLKRLGSQGQQKSFVIALKLAQFEVLKDRLGVPPLLLLDDIFDKLDDFRIERLLELIQGHAFGQLFVTDARPDRTASLLASINASSRMFRIEAGVISETMELSC